MYHNMHINEMNLPVTDNEYGTLIHTNISKNKFYEWCIFKWKTLSKAWSQISDHIHH